jgi:hypothetical protein
MVPTMSQAQQPRKRTRKQITKPAMALMGQRELKARKGPNRRAAEAHRRANEKRAVSLLKSPFVDYSACEWARIEECVAKAGLRKLSSDERLRLLEANRQYWTNLVDRERGTYAPASRRKVFWKKLRADLARVRQTLGTAAKLFGSGWRSTPYFWASDDLHHEICTSLLGPEYKPEMFIEDPTVNYLTLGHMVNLFAEFEVAALYRESDSISVWDTVTGRLDPSVVYYQEVLLIWHRLGGRLSLPGRNWKSGKLENDLIHFFRAIVDSVMLDNAPSDESIPDIVRRQKLLQPLLDIAKGTTR